VKHCSPTMALYGKQIDRYPRLVVACMLLRGTVTKPGEGGGDTGQRRACMLLRGTVTIPGGGGGDAGQGRACMLLHGAVTTLGGVGGGGHMAGGSGDGMHAAARCCRHTRRGTCMLLPARYSLPLLPHQQSVMSPPIRAQHFSVFRLALTTVRAHAPKVRSEALGARASDIVGG